jgi:hypothetical protein
MSSNFSNNNFYFFILLKLYYVLCHNHESGSRQIEKKVLRVWIKWKAHKDVRLAKNNKRWIVCQTLYQKIYAASIKLYSEKGYFTKTISICIADLHWDDL